MSKYILILTLVLIAGGTYYQFYSPAMVKKHATGRALQQFADAVATQDRAKVSAALQTLLTDDAHIRLEIGFFSLAQPEGGREMAQDFTKDTFIPFIDNTLYSLSDYSYQAQLHDFAPTADGKAAAITFASQEHADGMAYYGGIAVNMRYGSTTQCEGEVRLDGDSAKLATVTCHMHLRSLPKPGEESKLQNPDTLKDFLR